MVCIFQVSFSSVCSAKVSITDYVNSPNVLFLVFLGDQLVLSVIFQLVSGNLPEDLHVLCKIELHPTLLQVVLSGCTHRNTTYISGSSLCYTSWKKDNSFKLKIICYSAF